MNNSQEISKTQYPNGDIYFGTLYESLRTGFGELRTKSGDIFKGEWKMDRLNGVGKITYSNGKEYLGSFVEGIKHGIGQLTIGEKSYKGEFKDGKRTGYGVFNESDYEIRKGRFENGEHNGFGEVELKNTGNVYKGYFKHGKPNGPGIEITPDEEYSGEYEAGKKHGYGKIVEKGGFIFTGCFKFGEKTGFGHDRSPDGDAYAGEFLNGKKHGVGRLTGQDFNYTGGFFNNEYQGFGRIQAKDILYIGEWRESLENGLGYYKDLVKGKTYFGFWTDGKCNGVGYESYPGEDYKGEFQDGKRHGRGFIKRGDNELQAVSYNKGRVVGLIDSNDLHDLKVQFSQLKIDDFFKSSKDRLLKIDNLINQNLKKLEVSSNFDIMTFKDDNNILKRKLSEAIIRLENLISTFDKLQRKFSRDMQTRGNMVTDRPISRDSFAITATDLEDEDEMLQFMMGKSRSVSRSRDSLGGHGKTRGMISITNLSKMKIDQEDLDMSYRPLIPNPHKMTSLGNQLKENKTLLNPKIVNKKFIGDNSFDLLRSSIHKELSLNYTTRSPGTVHDDIIGGDDIMNNNTLGLGDIPWDSMGSGNTLKGKSKFSPQEPSLIKLIGNESSFDPFSKERSRSISRSRVNEFFMNDSDVGPLAKEFSLEMKKGDEGLQNKTSMSKDLEFGLSQLDNLADELKKERAKEKYYMQRLGKEYPGFDNENILKTEGEPEVKSEEIIKLDEEQRKLQERLEEVKRKKKDIEAKRIEYLEEKMNQQRADEEKRRHELRRQRDDRRQRSVELRKKHQELIKQQEDRRKKRLADLKKRMEEDENREFGAEELGLGLPEIEENNFTTLNNNNPNEVYTPIETNNPYKVNIIPEDLSKIENAHNSDFIKVDGFDSNTNDLDQPPMSPHLPESDLKSGKNRINDKENENPDGETSDIVYLKDLNSSFKAPNYSPEEEDLKSTPQNHKMSSDTGSMGGTHLRFEPQGLTRKPQEIDSPWNPKNSKINHQSNPRRKVRVPSFKKRHMRDYSNEDDIDVEFYQSIDEGSRSRSNGNRKLDRSLEDASSRFFNDKNSLTIRQLGSKLRKENKLRNSPNKNLRAYKNSNKKSTGVKKKSKTRLTNSKTKPKVKAKNPKERIRKVKKVEIANESFERRRKKKPIKSVKEKKREKTKEKGSESGLKRKKLREMAKKTRREERGDRLFENRYQTNQFA